MLVPLSCFLAVSLVCLVNNAAWVCGVGLVCACVRGGVLPFVVGWCGCVWWVRVLCGARFGFVWLLGCCFVLLVCVLVRVCLLKGCWAKVSVGVCGCLGAGCVVGGDGLPSWLGGSVAGGGVGVSFDVGLRVFVLSGVSVPALSSGSVSALAVSGSSLVGSLASGCGGAGVSAPVGSVSSLASLSDSTSASSPSSVSSCDPVVPECGGVVVCVPCACAVFGDSWCSLVLRRWARAAGVDVARVSGLLSSSVDCVHGSGSLSAASGSVSGSVPVVSSRVAGGRGASVSVASSSARSSVSALVSGGSVSASGSSRAGRVGVGFGARVRDWGARVGVGGGVVASWWGRARALVGGVVDGVSVWGLVGLCGVGVLVLVSVLVMVG